MDETKPWYTSRAVWGALVAMFSSTLMVAGHTIAPDLQSMLIDVLTLLGTSFGSGLALYGRIKASTKIGL